MFSVQPTTELDICELDISELRGLSVSELADELATLAAHLSAGMWRWLELVGEFDRRGDWAAWGHRSCAEWLAWRCALTSRSAREHVRVTRALPGLPLVRAAFSRGELSYAKVRALTRVAVPRNEPELLHLAGVLTASQLERALRAYRRVTTEEACELHDREQLDCFWDEDGSLVVRGRLAPEDGALFLQALEAARERLRQGYEDQGYKEQGYKEQGYKERGDEEWVRGSAEPPRRPSNVEALVAVADAALAHGAGRSGGDRYQVIVHVDRTALTGDDDNGSCVLADGPALAPETARRLACDAALVTVDEHGATPLNIGRKRRTIPPSLQRALAVRDRGCRYPGCDRHRFVDAHHIRHWANGGVTALDNLVLLCRHHHRLLHEGGCTVDRQQRFYDRHGRRIRPAPPQPRGTMGALRHANRSLDVTPATCAGGHGDRMDIDLAVEALLGIIGRPQRAQAA